MRLSSQTRVFYVACILIFILRIEWGIAASMLPIYVYELGASPLEVGLVSSVFAGIMMFTLPLWGYCSDYLGKRKPFIVLGMVGLSPIFLIMSMQTQITILILLRGSTALFVGAIVPAIWAQVSDVAPHKTVGRRLGLLTSAEMAGLGVGPIVGGIVADGFGFTALWMFVATICLAGGLVFLAFGSNSPILSRSNQKTIFKFSRKKSSLRKFFIPFIVFSFFLLGWSVLGPNKNVYLVGELGMSRTMVGAIELIGILSSTLLQPLLGSLSDKYGRRPLMTFAALSLIAGRVTLYLARDFFQATLSAIFMANYRGIEIASSAYVSDITKREERGGSLGLLNAVGSASRSFGSTFGGLIIMATSIRTTILLSTIFPAISIVITVLVLKESKKEEPVSN